MKVRLYQGEEDYRHILSFLREVFLLNKRSEHSWPPVRFDYWRWHLVENVHVCEALEKVTFIWETAEGEIAAVLHPLVEGELRLHVHPQSRSGELENEMLALAEERLPRRNADGMRMLYLPVDADDTLRQKVLLKRGYTKGSGNSHKWRGELDKPIAEPRLAAGYQIRAMGGEGDYPSRSWASWRAFHADEPVKNYDGDYAWDGNIQAASFYRSDLDIVAVTRKGEIVSFSTIFYDEATQSAVCVLVGTAVEHQRRGLGKAVMREGFRRLQELGCRRVFATAYDAAAEALYGSVMESYDIWETWLKEF
jgi:mycothiol synthase